MTFQNWIAPLPQSSQKARCQPRGILAASSQARGTKKNGNEGRKSWDIIQNIYIYIFIYTHVDILIERYDVWYIYTYIYVVSYRICTSAGTYNKNHTIHEKNFKKNHSSEHFEPWNLPSVHSKLFHKPWRRWESWSLFLSSGGHHQSSEENKHHHHPCSWAVPWIHDLFFLSGTRGLLDHGSPLNNPKKNTHFLGQGYVGGKTTSWKQPETTPLWLS